MNKKNKALPKGYTGKAVPIIMNIIAGIGFTSVKVIKPTAIFLFNAIMTIGATAAILVGDLLHTFGIMWFKMKKIKKEGKYDIN